MNKLSFFSLVLCCGAATCYGMEKGQSLSVGANGAEQTMHGVLIFLDDSEHHFGAITRAFFSAWVQKAGPIIVSASLIDNLRDVQEPGEKDPRKLKNIVAAIRALPGEERSLREQELKNIIVSTVSFDADLASQWILKEINSSLYLLLPRTYVQEKHISVDEVEKFSSEGAITPTEQQLGLKVNHMKTVVASQVRKPQEESFANYFFRALSDIFVTNREYPEGAKKLIPNWGIYITGHGRMYHSVCHLSVNQFKSFLAFLEKMHTRLLVYKSCYAAGVNAGLLYEDALTAITKTYDFAIITLALTDAPTSALAFDMEVEQGRLMMRSSGNYYDFMRLITVPDNIHYIDAVRSIFEFDRVVDVPQIKYPGLPWFSVLYRRAVAPIGSIMAKTRTNPLNIATFFAKQGKPATPFGILLYADQVPFELIVDTKDRDTFYVPAFVSMIPGDAVHHITKISSHHATVEDLVNAFYIKGQAPHKLFIVGEIFALFSETMHMALANAQEAVGTVSHVIIDVTEKSIDVFFTYNGEVYASNGLLSNKNQVKIAGVKRDEYVSLLKRYAPRQYMLFLQDQAHATFAQKMTSVEAAKKVLELLDAMPDNAALHIQGIKTDKALDLLQHVSHYHSAVVRKVVWIDEISDEKHHFDSVIIDVTPEKTRIFYFLKSFSFKKAIVLTATSTGPYDGDYMIEYRALFNSFDKQKPLPKTLEKKVDESSVQQLVTPESVANVRAAIEKKRSALRGTQRGAAARP